MRKLLFESLFRRPFTEQAPSLDAAGVTELATAVGRWKSVGAQWVMILSGAQSAVAGAFMILMAYGPNPVGIVSVAPYVAFGAFYFALSAIWLTISDARQGNLRTAS